MKIKKLGNKSVPAQKLSAPAKAAPKSRKTAVAKIASLFYRLLDGTLLQLWNCRKQDFVAPQKLEAGRLTGAPTKVVLVEGLQGTTVSVLPVKGTLADLGDGRVLDLACLKKYQVFAQSEAKAYFEKHARPVNSILGRGQKLVSKGLMLGDMSKMYVAWYDFAKKSYSVLQTKAINDGRNKDSVFALAGAAK